MYCRECDLSSLKSVRAFASHLSEREGRLDALVNSAGVMHHPRQYTEDGVEWHLAVNFLGHFLLTDLLTPLLKKY